MSEPLGIERPVAAHGWPKPGPITRGPDPADYPLFALPDVMQAAVKEYQSFGRQPVSMVACAALAQASIASQGLVDVARDNILIGPCSLSVLVIGQSGERKTGIDSAFSGAAKAWQQEERELLMPEHQKSVAMSKSHEARLAGVKSRIKALAGKTSVEAEDEIKELTSRLIELEQNPVFVLPVPRLYYEDVTPEALVYSLATGWPSSGLVSDEGGIVVGGRGMSEDSALSFLTILNRLWDGNNFQPDRKTAATAEIRGRRFSCSLMLQRELLDKILERGARGVGFFGRFLMAAPPSTMGTRLYTPPPDYMPALSAFGVRQRALLEMELPYTQNDGLTPLVMRADKEASAAWRGYHDQVETQLADYGEFAGVRDIGAKSAENAARIAAVLQAFAEGPSEQLRGEYMDRGIEIASWHLSEGSRIFHDAGKTDEERDAEALSEWLTTRARDHMDAEGRLPMVAILQYGPNRLRDRHRRDDALSKLAEDGVDHIRLETEGKRKTIHVNPRLLQGGQDE